MLSGRSTVVVAYSSQEVQSVLADRRFKLCLEDDGSAMELWHGSGERVPEDARVRDWPGIQPRGQISEYQLVVVR
eukprot:475035-Amphidinium_carterae.1